ncbi:hypothetical protein DAI22_03g127200 [Oryza sativa Japonica Group]|nr:hypothetical protein DAI22_03g127200 [Oryza sativa Japonica Group]
MGCASVRSSVSVMLLLFFRSSRCLPFLRLSALPVAGLTRQASSPPRRPTFSCGRPPRTTGETTVLGTVVPLTGGPIAPLQLGRGIKTNAWSQEQFCF